MGWIALAVTVAGIAYAIGVRSYLAWRTTGDTGLRLAAGPAGSIGWWAKLLFIASIGALLAGPVAYLLGIAVWHAPQGFRIAGLVLAVLAGGLVAAAQLGMGASWRIGVDRQEVTGLVTGGFFGLVRNPIFTGMIGFAVGIAAMVPGVVSALSVALVIGAIGVQVRAIEEPYLLATHGAAYRRYASETGRFLPGLGKRRG